MPLTKIIILGAGISGLSAAWKLASFGFRVILVEASEQVGGLAGTVRKDGYCLDFGPHSFFSHDEEIRRIFLELFEGTLQPQNRDAKFYFQGKYLDYPINAANLVAQMGFQPALQTGVSFLYQRLRRIFHKNSVSSEAQNVEEWVRENFGDYLYRFFFKPYTEQFWKMPCEELSARSIPSHTRMSFIKALGSLLSRKIKKSDSLIDRERLPTYYPPTGYGEVSERLLEKVLDLDGKLFLNSRAVEVWGDEDGIRVQYLQGGEKKEIRADHLISTIPLNLFVRMLRPIPSPEVSFSADRLDYRPLLMLGIVMSRKNVLNASYIYTLDRPYNRLTEMNRFSPATSPEGKNIITLEIPCSKAENTWDASAEELLNLCIPHLEKDGILKRDEVERLFVVKAEYAYPVYSLNYKEHLDRVFDYLKKQKRISIIGRSGEFRYMDIDQCMRRAFDLADTLKERINSVVDERV